MTPVTQKKLWAKLDQRIWLYEQLFLARHVVLAALLGSVVLITLVPETIRASAGHALILMFYLVETAKDFASISMRIAAVRYFTDGKPSKIIEQWFREAKQYLFWTMVLILTIATSVYYAFLREDNAGWTLATAIGIIAVYRYGIHQSSVRLKKAEHRSGSPTPDF